MSGVADGWAARLGWIVPSWNTVTEYEVGRLTPPSVSEHFTRIAHTEDSEAAFERMAREAPGATQLLADAQMDAICYACTSGSFFRGLDYDRELSARLSDLAGRPVLTMAHALIDGATALGCETVAVAAPYEQWLLDRLVAFIEQAGLRVVRSAGLGEQANVRHAPSKAIELAHAAWDPSADGLIMSCGNFRTLEAIDEIEQRIGRPVVTSVQGAVWQLLRTVGITDPIEHAGALLRETTPRRSPA